MINNVLLRWALFEAARTGTSSAQHSRQRRGSTCLSVRLRIDFPPDGKVRRRNTHRRIEHKRSLGFEGKRSYKNCQTLVNLLSSCFFDILRRKLCSLCNRNGNSTTTALPPWFGFGRCVVTAFIAGSLRTRLYGNQCTQVKGWQESTHKGEEEKNMKKKKVRVWADCPSLRFKVDGFIGKKEDTAGGGTFPQNRVRRGEMLGRGGRGQHPWQRALCGQRDALLTQPVQSRRASWWAAASQRQQQVETQSRSPWRVHDYPSSLVHQHIFHVHRSDVLTLYSVSLRSLIHLVLHHIHTYASSLSIQILSSKGSK